MLPTTLTARRAAGASSSPRARAAWPTPGRRRVLGLLAGSTAMVAAGLPAARAQDTAATDTASAPTPDAAQPFSYEALIETMRQRAGQERSAPVAAEGFFTGLNYDGYQRIQYDPKRARWNDGGLFRVHAFHLGWLFDAPVALYELADGQARPMGFSTDDFIYHQPLGVEVPAHREMPGVAGFRVTAPLNRADLFDEVVAFLGASYFRALGQGCRYGLSARGLAVNTGLAPGEEFPRFESFWLERPAAGATSVTVYAALDSDSVTGAYRFVITPGDPTRMEVDCHLFPRREVEQLGLAPLTSMFLYGAVDQGDFDDYRPAVHDSEGLVLEVGDQRIWRPLKNPGRLANSYFEANNPRAFGLVQRARGFDGYLDAGARYDLRPSLMIYPRGDWGPGRLRLVEIPTERETNDNIVAFWVPGAKPAPGEGLHLAYGMEWGIGPGETAPPQLARVARSLAGHGGVAGDAPAEDRRKFVIDFEGGLLRELSGAAEVSPVVTASGGSLHEVVLSQVEGTQIWRLVVEVTTEGDGIVELMAHLKGYGRQLSERWAYQWMRDA